MCLCGAVHSSGVSAGWKRMSQGMLCHQIASHFGMSKQLLWFSLHKAAVPGTCSAEPSLAPKSQEGEASCSQAHLPGSIGCWAHWLWRCKECRLGIPLTPGRGTNGCSHNKSSWLRHTQAVIKLSSMSTATRIPKPSPVPTPFTRPCSTHSGLHDCWGSPQYLFLSRNRDDPCSKKWDAAHPEGPCRAAEDTAQGQQGGRLASTSPGI